MAELKDYIKHIKQFTVKRQERDILNIVRGHTDQLEDYNTNKLFEGKDANDEFLSPPYASKFYAEFKLHLNPAGVVDLKLTGRYHSSIYADTRKFPVEMKSRDKKSGELKEKYGEDIEGITEEDKDEFVNEVIKEEVEEYYSGKVFSLP